MLNRSASEVRNYLDTGEALLRSGSLTDAIRVLRSALKVEPWNARGCRLLICALELSQCTQEAANAWVCIGEALDYAGNLDEAANAYQHAIRNKPDCLRALVRLGELQLFLGQPQKAVRCFETALEIDPRHTLAHVRLGWALDCLGEFDRAWKEFEWYHAGGWSRELEQPLWDGSPLRGRNILLWTGLGLGDAIRDLRYARLVQARGGRVIIECQPTLVTLFEQSRGVDDVVAQGAPLPAFDVHLPLSSLPRIFHTRRDTIPRRVPYLTADERLTTAWREKLGASRNVSIGIAWAGESRRRNARFRFASLETFAPLLSTPGRRFISLQLGPHKDHELASTRGLHLDWLLDESCTIADTAALVANLDLVITVDTMVAHLSGALAKPVWVLVPFAPGSWLWHVDPGETSAWYPTMRVFRQARVGNWSSVVATVSVALDRLAKTLVQAESSGI